MKCIDFDREFERYVSAWMKQNAEKYGNNMDVIEGMMPDIYMEFLEKPAAFLEGLAPQDYFEQCRICCPSASRRWGSRRSRRSFLCWTVKTCRRKRR